MFIDQVVATAPRKAGYSTIVWTPRLLQRDRHDVHRIDVSCQSVSAAIRQLRLRWKRLRLPLSRRSERSTGGSCRALQRYLTGHQRTVILMLDNTFTTSVPPLCGCYGALASSCGSRSVPTMRAVFFMERSTLPRVLLSGRSPTSGITGCISTYCRGSSGIGADRTSCCLKIAARRFCLPTRVRSLESRRSRSACYRLRLLNSMRFTSYGDALQSR